MSVEHIKRVFGKGGMWGQPLCVFEFDHDAAGLSRSGDFTVSVVIGPTFDQPMVMIVVAGHEATESMTFEQLNKWIETCRGDEMTEEVDALCSIRDNVQFLVDQYNNHDYL